MPANDPNYFSDLIKRLWEKENPEIIKWTMNTLILIHEENIQTRNFTVKKSAEYFCEQLKARHPYWASKRNKGLEQEFWELVNTTLIESITLYYNKKNAAEILSAYFTITRQDPDYYQVKANPYKRLNLLLSKAETYHHNVFKNVPTKNLGLVPKIKNSSTLGLSSIFFRIKGEKIDFLINLSVLAIIIYIASVGVYLLYNLVKLELFSSLQLMLGSPYFWLPFVGAAALKKSIVVYKTNQARNFVNAFQINTIELDISLQKGANRSVSFTMFKDPQPNNETTKKDFVERITNTDSEFVMLPVKPNDNLVASSPQTADNYDGQPLPIRETKKMSFFSAERKKISYKKPSAAAQTHSEDNKDTGYVVIEGTKKPNTQFLFYNIDAIEAQIEDPNLRRAYKSIAECPRIVRNTGAAGLVKINQKFSPFIKKKHTSGQLAVSCYQIKSPKYDERVMVRLVREENRNGQRYKYFNADTVINHKQKKLLGTVKGSYERMVFRENEKNSTKEDSVKATHKQFCS